MQASRWVAVQAVSALVRHRPPSAPHEHTGDDEHCHQSTANEVGGSIFLTGGLHDHAFAMIGCMRLLKRRTELLFAVCWHQEY